MAERERKTVKVEDLKFWANNFLSNSADPLAAERLGICTLLEIALQNANAYKGYTYLSTADPNWQESDGFGDQTRRRYY